MYADTTSNYRTWTATTNYAGSALTTGWNLIFVDISTGGSASGSGWTYTALSRYQEVFVTASSAAQTYTAILLDGVWFSHGDVTSWGPKYLEFTGYDTSNKNDFRIDAANTRLDGPLTLAATVAQNYTAGISAAAKMSLVRSTLSWSQSGYIGFDTALTSGTVATEQELRLVRTLRESLSGNYGAYIDMFNPQIYKVTAVGGSTIDVVDSENHSANLLNGDSIHIFTTTYNAGEPQFTLLATRAMTAGSSHSSGTTTLTLTTTSINVGDYVVKQNLAVSYSVVSATANESFSAMSYDTTPNGAQLIGSRSYPNPNNVYAHWWLGGPSETLALKDQTGNGRTLSKVGTPNLSSDFKSGKYSYGSVTAANYLRTPAGTAVNYDGVSEQIQFSVWVYYDTTYGGADRNIFSNYYESGGGTAAALITGIDLGASTMRIRAYSGGVLVASLTGSSLNSASWNHIVVQVQSATLMNIFVNGVKTTGSTPSGWSGSNSGQALYLGISSSLFDSGQGSAIIGMKMADMIVWRDGALLTQSDVNYLYNAGVPQWIGYNPAVLRNEYAVTGQSGQRISMKAKLNRSTTAVSPYILDCGMTKTG
jgi:hypothetical protein